jgi:phosphonate metabolism protein (transferase hexapeptide repeat family)
MLPEASRAPSPLLSEQPTIHESARIRNCQLGSWTEIGPGCTLVETSFDNYSYAADNVSVIYAQIGKFCSIASHVRINPGNHPIDRVTQHHMTYRRRQYQFAESDDNSFFEWRRSHACTIGHDVWIGHAATIMPGVTVHTGAVVGAGAIVTHDVAAYQIVVGVPARPLRMRFAPEIVEQLLAIAWWDWDRTRLTQRFDYLNDVAAFIALYGNPNRE